MPSAVKIFLFGFGLAVIFFGPPPAWSSQTQDQSGDVSLQNEVQHSLERGLRWLQEQQHSKGYWSQPDHPALTALALTAFMREPSGRLRAEPPEFIQKGYNYLLKCVQPDGGIYVTDLSNYNTSIAMMALVSASNPEFEPTLQKARNYVVDLQWDFNQQGVIDSPQDGGVGYGGTYKHSDMSNTMFALEALYYTRTMSEDTGQTSLELKKLDWQAALQFIQRCQNLPEYNDMDWASGDPVNKGGFVYFPGNTKAGEMELPSGKTALRSYGSISYAGLLSYIYADLDRDDPRVEAVLDWLKKNYTLEENPGMGLQGLYYYYHTMAKALAAYGAHELKLADGSTIDWRRDLALKLLDLQKADGFWINESGRWWEKDPVLVTSYAVITLEILHKGL